MIARRPLESLSILIFDMENVAMDLQRVVDDYVSSRRGSVCVSTRAAAQTISSVFPLPDTCSKIEFENLIAEAAVKRGLSVHFDAVDLPTQPVSNFV